MAQRLTRDRLKQIILQERRAVTRQLISEGGCGCGGCATCKSNLSGMMSFQPHDESDEMDAVTISYDDDGLPSPKHYMDHAEAGALTHSYPYEEDTDGDIVHGHDYGQSYMAKQHLHTIIEACHELDSMIHGDEELEEDTYEA